MENVGFSRGRVLDAENKGISYDSVHTVAIGEMKIWYRLFKTLELRPEMGLRIAADATEGVCLGPGLR